MNQEPEASGNTQTQTTLPLWRRLLFATILPNVVVYLAVYYWVKNNVKGPPSGPDSLGILDVVTALVMLIGGIILFALPIAICTLRAAFRPSRRWYTALLGGFCGVLIGASIGGTVLLAIYVLTR